MKINANSIGSLLCAASLVAAAPAGKRQSGTSYDGGITANDVENGICAPLTLIFARGSTETGNMGSTVGPALAKALISSVGASGVAVQGVDYTASIESNISEGADGGPELAKLAAQALQNCPKTKIAIAGYSQGAMVCHYAVAQGGLSADDVSSAVLYGDPLDGESVGTLPANRLKEFCATGDGVCEDHGFFITAAHLSYADGPDIGAGAQFITQNAGTPSTSSPSGGSSAAPSTSATIPGLPAESSNPFLPTESSGPFGGFGGLGGLGGSSGGSGGLGGLNLGGLSGLRK